MISTGIAMLSKLGSMAVFTAKCDDITEKLLSAGYTIDVIKNTQSEERWYIL